MKMCVRLSILVCRGRQASGLVQQNLTIRTIVAINRSLAIDVDSNCSELFARTGGVS